MTQQKKKPVYDSEPHTMRRRAIRTLVNQISSYHPKYVPRHLVEDLSLIRMNKYSSRYFEFIPSVNGPRKSEKTRIKK
jgi:hypothetical protein